MLNTIEQAMQRAEQMRASGAGDTIVTPKGAAVVASRRFLEALAALDPDTREIMLASVVVQAPGPEADVSYSLATVRTNLRQPN